MDASRTIRKTVGTTRRAAVCAIAAMSVGGALAACGSGGSTGSQSATEGGSAAAGESAANGSAAGQEVKMGIALFGPKNDRGFNQEVYEGVMDGVKQHPNIKVTSVLENRETVPSETNAAETLAPINQLVIGGSTSWGTVLDTLADQFPDTYFLTNGYTKALHKNVTGVALDYGPATYLAGVAAGMLTKTNTVGYIGGAEIPPTTQGVAGFKQGVKSVSPSIKVLVDITGSYNDIAKGKAATASLISENADVIASQLDAGEAGTNAAAKEAGKDTTLIKITTPDCERYDNMVGTAIVDNKATFADMMDGYATGTLKPGTIFIGTQDPKLERFELCSGSKYAKDTKLSEAIEEAVEEINSGKVKIVPAGINPRPSYPYREGFEGSLVQPSTTK